MATLHIDPDVWQAASHRSMAAHLTGPFQAGAVDSRLDVGSDGRVIVDFALREPLLLVAPGASLEDARLLVRPFLITPDAHTPLGPLEFAPFTESGALLPLYLPPPSATPFAIRLDLDFQRGDEPRTPVPPGDVGGVVEVRLLQGLIGRVLYVMAAEKQRIRRQAREIAAMRLVTLGRDNALDCVGAELSVPRFTEQIDYTPTRGVFTFARREPDAEYRRRLDLYRAFALPNRRRLVTLLNGPGGESDPNRGVLAELGFTSRFNVVEEDNQFAIAIHLVAADNASQRTDFLTEARRYYLIWPRNDPNANAIHAARHLPAATQQRVRVLRESLRTRFRWPASAAVAPLLALALDRLGKVRAELGGTAAWPVQRAQDATAGSRYELGLGVDVEPLSGAALEQLRARHGRPNRPPSADPEIEALLRSLQPLPASEDPDGRWLIEPCGLRTVHRLSDSTLYLSHVPTFGLVITGGDATPVGTPLALEAHYEAPGEPGSNAVLAVGLASAAVDWASANQPAWTVLGDAAARARWSQVTDRASTDPALEIFRAAGLPAITTVASVVERLGRLPTEMVETIQLAASLSQAVLSGQAEAADRLRQLARVLGSRGIASALPLIEGPDVLLVVGVIGLPEAGINLADRRTTGFRWSAVPVLGSPARIRGVGGRTELTCSTPGLTAVVVIGYARAGLTDPFEFRVELPAGAHLSLLQYEFLMNVLDRAFPIGVEINTFAVRREHVDLDGDGTVDPLLPVASRTFRSFRRPRSRGETGVPVQA